MARKRTLNYRELRQYDDDESGRPKDEDSEEADEEEEDDEDEEEEAVETAEGDEAEEGEDEEEAEVPVKSKKKKVAAPKPPKVVKPKRTRASKVVRLRVVWGVYNNSNQRVATYDYARKQEAEEHAAKLSAEKNKGTYFIQPVKEPMEEK